MEEQPISIFPVRTVYAGFWERFWSSIIDGLVLMVPQSIINITFGTASMFEWTGHGMVRHSPAVSLIDLIMDWLYIAIMTSGRSQATLGMRALKIKMTDTEGNRISFGVATGRYFASFISFIILLIGYFMMLWDDRKQTLHDKIAGTLIIKNQANSI